METRGDIVRLAPILAPSLSAATGGDLDRSLRHVVARLFFDHYAPKL